MCSPTPRPASCEAAYLSPASAQPHNPSRSPRPCPAPVGYGSYDGIAPARNSIAIASRIRGAELRGYEGGHLFLFRDPAALPEYQAFLHAPPA